MSKPRVTASHETEALTTRAMCGPTRTTPGVVVEVSFDLHDHHTAIALLDRAVQEVKAQIEETQ